MRFHHPKGSPALQLEHFSSCFTHILGVQKTYHTLPRACGHPQSSQERDPNKRVTSDKDDAQEEWALTTQLFDAEMYHGQKLGSCVPVGQGCSRKG